jgi:CubicO group peptidase (beta-lactamase class C family)
MKLIPSLLFLLQPFTALLSAQSISRRLDAYLRPFVETANLSGAVLVMRGDSTVFHKAYGLADPAFDIPNATTTRFHIASVSKAFTAAAVLILEEEGKLKTSDSVARFLPDYPNGARIRIDHLLQHSSGIPNVGDFPELRPGVYVPYAVADIVAAFRDKPLESEPGAQFRYTNSEYNLLAWIIERVSGQSFGDFLEERVLRPLGLSATVNDADARRVIARSAVGTEPDGLRDVQLRPYLGWSTKIGSGSLVSSTSDLCAFARGVFEGKLLSAKSRAKLMSVEGVLPYGWEERERAGRKGRGAGGRSPGFISNLEYYPAAQTCIAILTNSYSSVGQVIARDISTIALGGSATPPQIAYVKPRPGSLAAFTGRYQMPANYYTPNAILTIEDRGDYLIGTWANGGTNVIYPTGSDAFVDRTFWAEVTFERNGGRVTGFVYRLLQDFHATKLPS